VRRGALHAAFEGDAIMGFFEQNPLMLILVIVATIEGWAVAKPFLKRTFVTLGLRRSKEQDV
jgi:hypothetical protein